MGDTSIKNDSLMYNEVPLDKYSALFSQKSWLIHYARLHTHGVVDKKVLDYI